MAANTPKDNSWLSKLGRWIWQDVHQFPCRVPKFMRRLKPRGTWLLKFITGLSVLVILLTFVFEMEDRQAERTFRAWETILSVERSKKHNKKGGTHPILPSDAMYEAVEYLNREFDGRFCSRFLQSGVHLLTGQHGRECLFPRKRRVDLVRRNFSGAQFVGIHLPSAMLISTDLTRANLAQADLTKARLLYANLTWTLLSNANLTRADLVGANLTRADLGGANLADAILRKTNLTEAKMQGARGLTSKQLEQACISKGGEEPSLPDGIVIDWSTRLCPRGFWD